MSIGLTPLAIYEFIDARLRSDSTLMGMVGNDGGRLREGVLPVGATLPGIVFTLDNPTDNVLPGQIIVWTRVELTVRVIGVEPSYVPLAPIASRLFTLLHGSAGTATDGTVLAVTRLYPLLYSTDENGQDFRHLGGVYEILAQ